MKNKNSIVYKAFLKNGDKIAIFLDKEKRDIKELEDIVKNVILKKGRRGLPFFESSTDDYESEQVFFAKIPLFFENGYKAFFVFDEMESSRESRNNSYCKFYENDSCDCDTHTENLECDVRTIDEWNITKLTRYIYDEFYDVTSQFNLAIRDKNE